MSTRTAHWAMCENCETCVVVYPHPDRETDVPDHEEWEGRYTNCMVCEDGYVLWGGSDPASEIIKNY